jgi:hypothetical protein
MTRSAPRVSCPTQSHATWPSTSTTSSDGRSGGGDADAVAAAELAPTPSGQIQSRNRCATHHRISEHRVPPRTVCAYIHACLCAWGPVSLSVSLSVLHSMCHLGVSADERGLPAFSVLQVFFLRHATGQGIGVLCAHAVDEMTGQRQQCAHRVCRDFCTHVPPDAAAPRHARWRWLARRRWGRPQRRRHRRSARVPDQTQRVLPWRARDPRALSRTQRMGREGGTACLKSGARACGPRSAAVGAPSSGLTAVAAVAATAGSALAFRRMSFQPSKVAMRRTSAWSRRSTNTTSSSTGVRAPRRSAAAPAPAHYTHTDVGQHHRRGGVQRTRVRTTARTRSRTSASTTRAASLGGAARASPKVYIIACTSAWNYVAVSDRPARPSARGQYRRRGHVCVKKKPAACSLSASGC